MDLRDELDTKHKHLILTGTYRNVGSTSFEKIVQARRMMLDIVDALGMKLLSGLAKNPDATYCTDPGNEGLTCSCLITTSHMMLHTWDKRPGKPPLLQADVYTCSDLPAHTVMSLIDKAYDLVHCDYRVFDRAYVIVEEKAA